MANADGLEPVTTTAAAPTSAVRATGPAGLAMRTRWLIGGGVAAVAVVAAVGAALVLSARPVPEAEKYIPGNAVIVGELRLDLPGDQFQKVGNLLAHFPGFADQSTLSAKLDESLDRLAKGATNGTTDYTTNLKPWLTGPTFVGILPGAATGEAGGTSPAPTGTAGSGPSAAASADGVIVATTDGTATCTSVIQGGTSQSIPQGTLLVSAGGDMACFIDGKFGLVGTPAGVKAALAAHAGGTGIDHDARYAKARDSLGGDRLATVYVSGAASALMQSAEASLPASLPISLPTAASLPDWLIAGVRAEDDALVTDVLVAPGSAGTSGSAGPAQTSLPTLPPAHESDIAGFMPGNTVLLGETHGAGVAAQNAIAVLRSDPDFQAEASELDAALGLAGGAEGVVGWISDAGVVAIPQSTTPAAGAGPGLDVGLVLVATDDATAAAKEQQLKSLLSVVALSAGGNAQDESVDGATVTTIDLGDLSTLIGSSGAASQLGGLTIPPNLDITLTLAVRGRLVLLGGDDGFARDVLGAQAGLTLADDAVYKRSLTYGSASNLGQVYVAGASVRDLVSRLLPADQQARWQADILPYATPIDAALLTTTVDNGVAHVKLVIAVSTPAATAGATP
jgi:hypothetical protein